MTTTYSMIPRLDWLYSIEWGWVILDEAQAIKNAATRQTRAVKKLHGNMRVALTGTPVENRLGDLWSIFDFLNPGLLGSASRFKAFEQTDGDGIQRRGLVLSYLMRFKQICNHPSQLTGDAVYDPAASAKFDRLGMLCSEIASRGEKALVFTQFREITDPLAEYLATVFGRTGLVLHGGTPVKKRRQLVADFQHEEGPPFFVLSIKAGGTGLNLTAATHVIHFDRWWNPAVENQATDRAFRIGQKCNVLVHKFVTRGTIEEKVDALIREKQGMADALLEGGGEKALTEMSDDEILDMVSLDIERAMV